MHPFALHVRWSFGALARTGPIVAIGVGLLGCSNGQSASLTSDLDGVAEGSTSSTSSTSADDPTYDDGPNEGGDHDSGIESDSDADSDGETRCNPGTQDCPDPNDKCTAHRSTGEGCCVDANHCAPAGERAVGDSCVREDDNDDCARGLFCMTTTSGGSGPGICVAFCDPHDATTCDGECVVYNDGVLPLCQRECDPLAQDCVDEQGCYLALERFVCARPAYTGDGSAGTNCYTIQSCAPGNLCTEASSLAACEHERCCTPLCDVREPDACPNPHEACVPVFDESHRRSGAYVGICAVP